MSAAGATVVFSTHVMQHAERLCDKLLLLAGAARSSKARSTRRAPSCRRGCRSSRGSRSSVAGVEELRADAARPRTAGSEWDVGSKPGVAARRRAPACTERAIPAAAVRRAAGEPARRLPPDRRPGGGAPMKNILIVAAPRVPPDRGDAQLLADAADPPAGACRSARSRSASCDDDEPDRVMVIDRTGGGEARVDRAALRRRPRPRHAAASCRATSSATSSSGPIPPRRGRSTTAGTATPTSPAFRAFGRPRRGAWRRSHRVKPAKDTPDVQAAQAADYEIVPVPARACRQCPTTRLDDGAQAGAQARRQASQSRSITFC